MRIKTRRSDEGIIPASYVALRLEILHAVVVRLKATEWQTFAARWKGSWNDFDRWRNRFRNHYPVNARGSRVSKTSNFSSNFVSTFICCTVTGTARVLWFYLWNTETNVRRTPNDSRVATIHGFATISRILQQRGCVRRWRLRRGGETRGGNGGKIHGGEKEIARKGSRGGVKCYSYLRLIARYLFNVPRRLHGQGFRSPSSFSIYQGIWWRLVTGEKEGGDKKAVERKAESGGCRDRARVVRCNFREIIDRIEIMKRPCQS